MGLLDKTHNGDTLRYPFNFEYVDNLSVSQRKNLLQGFESPEGTTNIYTTTNVTFEMDDIVWVNNVKIGMITAITEIPFEDATAYRTNSQGRIRKVITLE